MKFKFFFFVFLFNFTYTFGQQITSEDFKDRGEVYFKFVLNDKESIKALTKDISIDNIKGNIVYAYANQEEFSKFLEYNLPYEKLPAPGIVKNIQMSNDLKEISDWNVYPTYDAYVTMMNQFASNHPSICRIVDAGNTVNGRKILYAVISDSVNTREAEPQFMYSSSMHGDELTGYVSMLRLIDSLLTTYGTAVDITNLVNNAEIWICPLANPDGTYKSGNTTVNGAVRYNANNIDLNRNFPDPYQGPYPTGTWQPETVNMMTLASNNNFVLSANFHGGAEVVNYPWDCFVRLHPDNSWFYDLSRKYADTVHAHSVAGYMDDLNNGITNGYAWYPVYGGRQDYMTYFKRGREVTIELSNTKLLPASSLPTYWEYNRRSLLNYMKSVLYGIKGKVTDNFGNPVKAKIIIVGHEADSSEVYSSVQFGDFYRLIAPGTYNVQIVAPNLISQTITNVVVNQNQATELNIQLMPVPVELTSFTAERKNNKVFLSWTTATELNNYGFEILKKQNEIWEYAGFVKGNGTSTEKHSYNFLDENNSSSTILYRLKQIDVDGSINFSNEVEVIGVPAEFVLEQNYPNPFNPTTRINFTLPIKANVVLKVFDVLGNEAAILINENREAGFNSIEFDASKFTSGIYFYEIKAGDFSAIKKMILIK